MALPRELIPTFAVVIAMVFPLGGYIVFDAMISLDALSTQRAPGVTDARLSQVTPGMTTSQAVAILGQPLRINAREWWYSQPKEPVEGWGRWNARYLYVLDGIVVEVHRYTAMNH